MSSLAGDDLRYQPPSAFMAETGIMNPFVVQLLWCGLSLDTRRGYTTAIHSYEYFCAWKLLLRGQPHRRYYTNGFLHESTATAARPKYSQTQWSTTVEGESRGTRWSNNNNSGRRESE